jgi:hypothetical protein
VAVSDAQKLKILMFGENKAASTFLEEENVRYFISFEINILIVCDY